MNNQKRLNVLLATTRQWNVGDEFISHGVKNLLSEAWGDCNFLIYNKNPIFNNWVVLDLVEKGKLEVPHDNSWTDRCQASVDAVVFCGTPEWGEGWRTDYLSRLITKQELPCFFIGMGAGSKYHLNALTLQVLSRHTRFFSARDALAAEAASSHVEAHRLPCPSLFASTTERADVPEKPGKIGLVLQGTTVPWQNVPSGFEVKQRELIPVLRRSSEVKIICHFISELEEYSDLAPELHYSGDSRDYYHFYDGLDLVISPRLHACGLAASMGIPSICFYHEKRVEAALDFYAILEKDPAQAPTIITHHHWNARSQAILDLKDKYKAIYLNHLRHLRPEGTEKIYD